MEQINAAIACYDMIPSNLQHISNKWHPYASGTQQQTWSYFIWRYAHVKSQPASAGVGPQIVSGPDSLAVDPCYAQSQLLVSSCEPLPSSWAPPEKPFRSRVMESAMHLRKYGEVPCLK